MKEKTLQQDIKSEKVSFPENYDELVPVTFLRQEIKNIDSSLNIFNPGSKVLDMGCGAGYFSNYFKEKGCDIEGVDIDPKKIEDAKRLYPGINFEIARDSGLGRDKYGSVFCNMVVCNIEDEEKLIDFLKNIYDSLKKSGSLFLTNADININFHEGDYVKHTLVEDFNEGSPVLVQLLQHDGRYSTAWKNYIWSREKLVSLIGSVSFCDISSQYIKDSKYYYILAKKG